VVEQLGRIRAFAVEDGLAEHNRLGHMLVALFEDAEPVGELHPPLASTRTLMVDPVKPRFSGDSS
jgi:hypothetical protein